MVVKVLIYAYATGVFSSRAIARKLEEDVAFRVLAAGIPQHRTICEFQVAISKTSSGYMGVVPRPMAGLQEEARLKEEIEGLLERAGAVDGERTLRRGDAR